MEESHGLRPLEFAAQQGTLQLMSAIFKTPKVYVVREEIVGISVYQWYDVTEYVAIGEEDNRHSVSPLNFLSMLDQKVLDRSSTRDILLNGVLFDWVKLELYCRHSLFIAYNLYRLLYFVAVVVYEMDSFWLDRFGSILTDRAENETVLSRVTCGFGPVFTMPVYLRHCIEAFLFMAIICDVILETSVISLELRKLIPGTYLHSICSDIGGKMSLASSSALLTRSCSNIFIGIITIAEIAVLYTDPNQITATIIVYVILAVSSHLFMKSLFFYLPTLPGLGHLLICMGKIYYTFFMCDTLMMLFVLTFTRLEILFFATDSNVGCVQQFSDLFSSLIRMCMTILNMQNYTEFDVKSPAILYVTHVCFVLIVAILLFNLMIALFTDIISKVQENKAVEVMICQLTAHLQFEEMMFRLPILRKLYIRFTRGFLVRTFLTEQNRFLIIGKNVPKTQFRQGYRPGLVLTCSDVQNVHR